MRASDDQPTFRAWLVKQLTLTRWSARLDMADEALAEHLGVQVSVLLESRALREAELKKRGLGGRVKGKRRYVGTDYAELAVGMPRSIYDEWRAFCTARQVEPGTVFRSIIHHFLLHPARPPYTQSWIFRGRLVSMGPWSSKGHEPRARTRVTRGAQIALDTHADSWNLRPAALMRGLLIDFLEGKILKMKMIAFSELWGDPDRYLHPEKFL